MKKDTDSMTAEQAVENLIVDGRDLSDDYDELDSADKDKIIGYIVLYARPIDHLDFINEVVDAESLHEIVASSLILNKESMFVSYSILSAAREYYDEEARELYNNVYEKVAMERWNYYDEYSSEDYED